MSVDVKEDNIDMLCLSAHKMYGPKGVGCLYVRRRNPRVRLSAQMDGGGHERGMRSGTMNVPGIVGLGKACELCEQEMKKDTAHALALRDRFEKKIFEASITCISTATQTTASRTALTSPSTMSRASPSSWV